MAITVGHDSANTRKTLEVGGKTVAYYAIPAAEAAGLGDFSRLPAALKVVLENMLRFEDGKTVTQDDIRAFSDWAEKGGKNPREIAYRPARVLMQDFTGVPAVVDLAAMRDGIVALGGDAQQINPLNPVDLVIDHSVMIDEFGNPRAFQVNVDREYERNLERYQFLKWGQKAFRNFRVVPPGTGICHQVNLEYLAQVVWSDTDQSGQEVAYPDTLVGTDSHTTMVNGAAVLGWGVGGIEAEAAMLGQPISMLIPEVVGFKLTGKMTEGTTATDLVLKVVQMLRQKGVVNKFVEFWGDGLDHVPLADRATIGNMAPEYGATCGFFPIDEVTLTYMRQTGRDEARIALVEAYAKAQGMWRGPGYAPVYTDTLELDMGTVVPAISGPKRPQDHIPLDRAASDFGRYVEGQRTAKDATPRAEVRWEGEGGQPEPQQIPGDEGHHRRGFVAVEGDGYQIHDGSIVIASITSCTNTSNPYVMIGAGLVAKKAREKGLTRKPWVKTSLAPGSQVVSAYLEASGLQDELDAIGFNLVGYGCTTCIGNSGPLAPEISKCISDNDLIAVSVLSGNRNFEGRISPDVRANYLASPPLVVAYALIGDMNVDITTAPLGQDQDGNDVFLKDLWPSQAEIAELVEKTVTRAAFQEKYADVFKGDDKWRARRNDRSRDLRLAVRLDLRPEPALLPEHVQGSRPDRRHQGRACARDPRRHGDDRPHLARGLVQGHHAGRKVSHRPPGAAARVQLVRLAARQPRGDDARHLRQHPNPERDAGRGRGRLHAGPGRRADLDLRRRDGLPGAGHAARHLCRRAVWRGVEPRLGGEGHRAPRRQGGDRRELRAHPPLEPRRHGRDPVRVHRRRHPQVAEPQGRRDGVDRGPGVGQAAAGGDGDDHLRRRHHARHHLKCRIDTAIEVEYIEHGGVLHYVLRNLAKAA